MTTKLTVNIDKENEEKLRKLSKLTDFSISHIIIEIVKISFKNGLAKDLFWLYLKDHNDPFLEREIIKDTDNSLLLKEAFSTIEAILKEQGIRVKELEQNQRKIVNEIVNGDLKRTQLTDFLTKSGSD